MKFLAITENISNRLSVSKFLKSKLLSEYGEIGVLPLVGFELNVVIIIVLPLYNYRDLKKKNQGTLGALIL